MMPAVRGIACGVVANVIPNRRSTKLCHEAEEKDAVQAGSGHRQRRAPEHPDRAWAVQLRGFLHSNT